MNDGVTTVIPGARNAAQAAANSAAADVAPISDKAIAAVAEIYQRRIAPYVDARW